MTDYLSFHSTVPGYSHILKHTGCEDYSASLDDGDVHIAVVSDGHGEGACFRSDIGSRLAAETAAEQLHSFAGHIRQEHWEQRLLDPDTREELVRQLIRSIIGNWAVRILDHLERFPITDHEWELSGSYREKYESGRELRHIYGCTLIAVLVTPRYLLALQQGDGRFVLIRQSGEICQPIPWDPRCVGNVCTSLCHDDAVESCRYALEDLSCRRIAACFASSDGIEDSMESQTAVNAYFGHLLAEGAENGVQGLTSFLSESLPEMSRYGSLDDMSAAGILAFPVSPVLARRLELSYQKGIAVQKVNQAENKLLSMKRKTKYLQDQVHLAESRLKAAERSGSDTAAAVKALEDAQKALDEYAQRRSRFLAAGDTARQKISEIEAQLIRLPPLPDDSGAAPPAGDPEWEFKDEVSWEDCREEPVSVSDSGSGPCKGRLKKALGSTWKVLRSRLEQILKALRQIIRKFLRK